ncbi:MAG: hypothetical protein ACP5VF_03705 [Acidobacteriota bacterium]
MTRLSGVVAGLVFTGAVGTALFAAGGGLRTGSSPQSSKTTLTVTIPGVVGIDIETDLTWDFGSYPAGKISSPSPNNLFPPPPFNTAAAYWTPTAATTTSGAPAPAPTWTPPSGDAGAAAIWMALFCNIAGGANVTLTAQLATWQGGTPFGGANPAVVQTHRDSQNNPKKVGRGNWTTLKNGTNLNLGRGSLAKSFPWTRADQRFWLYTTKVSACTFNPGTYTNTVTITLSK